MSFGRGPAGKVQRLVYFSSKNPKRAAKSKLAWKAEAAHKFGTAPIRAAVTEGPPSRDETHAGSSVRSCRGGAVAVGGAGPAARQGLVRDQLGGQAEHGGFYQALADGTYRKYGLDVTIVPGGPNVNNRILLPVGKHRVLHERQHAAGLRRGRAEHPDPRGGRPFQKDPQVSGRASRTRASRSSRTSRSSRCSFPRRAWHLLPVDEERLRLQRSAGEALHLQPAAVPRRQEARPCRATSPPSRSRSRSRRLQAEGVPARRPGLQHLFDADRDAPRAGGEEARPGAALRRCVDDRLVQLPLRRQQGGQRADQGATIRR